MLQKLRNRAAEEKGFTLIELLVVILIIGILAAIALPVFLGQQEKGQDAAAKSDARNAFSQVEACYADSLNQNYQTDCNDATKVGGAEKTGFTFQAGDPDAAGEIKLSATAKGTFSVTAWSKSGATFTITKTDGVIDRSCTPISGTNYSAGCKAGDW